MMEKLTVRGLPSLTTARAVQKRRGMLSVAHGRKAISRTLSKPVICSAEFQ